MLRYYITDRTQFPGDEATRRRTLLESIVQAGRSGVDYIQLREKDLSANEFEKLAREVMDAVRELRTGNQKLKTGLLINSRADIALACAADGVHLRSDDISPAEVRKIWAKSGAGARAIVGVSCHTAAEVADAATQGADFAVFGPVFEKKAEERKSIVGVQPAGLDGLRQACRARIPVLALGGITAKNAEACIQAGAAGIAGIRFFQHRNGQCP